MSVRSINEPHSSRLFNFSHPSINEPPVLPSMEVPVLTNIDPDTAVIGGEDVTMTATGTGFSPGSVITFNGGDETTVFVSTTELTTIVKPSTATTPGTYPVTVVNGEKESAAAGFTFTEAGGAARAQSASWTADDPDMADPDDMEDEIEQAEEEGEFKSLHVSKTKVSVKKTKR